MPRQEILSPQEQHVFDTPPCLTSVQRNKYFAVSASMLEIIQSLRTPTTQVCFLVQFGYFRATRSFFLGGYHAADLEYAARQLTIEASSVDSSTYEEATVRRHQRLILEHLGYSSFDEQARKRLLDHLKPLIRSQLRPKALFEQALHFLPNR